MRKVRLTTRPQLDTRFVGPKLQARVRGSETWTTLNPWTVENAASEVEIKRILAGEWPGVEFELPAEGGWSGRAVETATYQVDVGEAAPTLEQVMGYAA